MDPLAVVEAQLGSVYNCPPYVLRLMFMLEPNPRVMKKVAAFMYGNNLKLSDAVACYKACNGRHQAVLKLLRAWNDVWDRDVNQRHKEQYYSMLLKCFAWINGKALGQYAVVKPVVLLSKYGLDATRYPVRIRRMIESIRSSVV